MAHSYDLAVEDFLPVHERTGEVGGRTSAVSLPSLFLRAHELTGIEVPVPPAEAGLWRILYLLTARITGLDDRRLRGDAWHERREQVWDRGHFDPHAVTGYFARLPRRFDLFHPQLPWLQDPRLATECDKSAGVNKLVPDRPSGQNQVWFSHHWEGDPQPITPAQAVWYLLAQLYYGPSGRCAARTVGGRKEANSNAGPLRSVVSFHPLGATVFETLVAGLCPPDDYEQRHADIVSWESDVLPDPLAAPTLPGGYAALAGRFQHAILLTPSPDGQRVVDARITWALRDKVPPTHDPYLIYQISKQGNEYARPARADRAVFRDLDALLCKSTGDPGVTRPAVLNAVQQLGSRVGHLRIRAIGFDQDGQTRDKQWFAQTTPALLGMLEERHPAAAFAVSRWRKAAELAGRNLDWALRRMWVTINDPSNGAGTTKRKDLGEGPWVSRGAAVYWAQAERHFWRLVHGGDYTADDAVFFHTARDVFDQITETPSVQPRRERARARCRGLIFAGRPQPTTSTPKGTHDTLTVA